MMVAKTEHLNKYAVKGDTSYVAKVGFDKKGETCVKWYVIKGWKAATINSRFYRYGESHYGGSEIIDLSSKNNC